MAPMLTLDPGQGCRPQNHLMMRLRRDRGLSSACGEVWAFAFSEERFFGHQDFGAPCADIAAAEDSLSDQGNLFAGVDANAADERFDALLTRPNLRIERIVSTGQASAPGHWYDQPQTEWVVLLSGSAVLRFEDEVEPRILRPGDWMTIAPHRRHRVEATEARTPSLWLAVHVGA